MEKIKTKKRNSLENKASVSSVLLKILTVFLACMILFPYLYLISTSLLTREEFYSSMPPIFSSAPQWKRYYVVLIEKEFYRSVFNSVLLAGTNVITAILVNPFIAYGLSRFRFKGRFPLFVCMLCTMFLPAQVSSIPKFLFYKEIGWLYTYLPLIVPGFFGSASGVLFQMGFMKAIPKEMDEAAKIDGAGVFRVWLQIIMPQLIPPLCLTALNAFLSSWKSSYNALIYLRDPDMFTVPLTLLKFQANDSFVEVGKLQLYSALVIAIVPITVLWLFLQHIMNKYVVVADLK